MPITHGYCTRDELKHERLKFVTANQDAAIDDSVNAASRAIDGHTGRRFWKDTASSERVYPGCSGVLYIADAWEITSVKTDDDRDGTFETTWVEGTDYQAEPLNGVLAGIEGWPTFKLRPLDRRWPVDRNGRALVQVDAKWGWENIPDAVHDAALRLATAKLQRAQNPTGVIGGDEFGTIRLPRNERILIEDMLLEFCRVGGTGIGSFA